MIKLSVVLISYNEERNIGRCLDSVQNIADEILVVDSYSTDKTVEICEAKGARVVPHVFENFIKQRNFADSQAQNPYVLILDADEVISLELAVSIQKIKENWQYDVYEFNRLNNYCGQWIKHSGWYPEWRPRLFDKRQAHWEGQLVHERLAKNAGVTTGRASGNLLHYSYNSIAEHIQKTNRYTDLTAQEAFEKGKKSSLFKIWFNPKWRFIRDYVINGGFKDGFMGYTICKISAWGTFLKYSKLQNMHHKR
ncbi:MAG: glycosyl transferase [Bacteroidetes bacterium 4572_77]|nr:MAG: glycosyl transferase [Bacteroidetes bacterium 4572_77]